MSIILICNIFSGCTVKANNEDFLRIHIVANSNSQFDQTLKNKVRDCIVDYLSQLLLETQTKDQAKIIIEKNKNSILALIDEQLVLYNSNYQGRLQFKKEEFPARVYDNIVFEKGVYDAVIITLGQGQGDNWWCVAFPPLCFIPANGDEIRYKSKIMEIINYAK